MTKERIEEIKQMQHQLFLVVKKIGCVNVANNSTEVNQLMIYFSMLQETIQELVQELEKHVKE